MPETRQKAKLADMGADEVYAIQREAARGNPAAIFIIGMAHCRGDRLALDREKGKRLIEIAASGGHGPAILELGLMEARARARTAETRDGSRQTRRSGLARIGILRS